ncbi:Uncharacterized conserved protein [Catalinimonas alkaloidigena]|uniref:Uncharacterized conserved protein n=1 Tax=Catalinimonas alkaloidigena TaxID=1075417 RepID=A0A1G9ULW8_9BACT|nr:hypothetical protein [Catalinimonas alkaloidigena]SDM60930.1 Uncharacterized conserved protein [Catalinimonas alkaloidigena]
MKKLYSLSGRIGLLALALPLLQACTDTCERTNTYTTYEAVYTQREEFKNSIGYEAPHKIETPGKIFRYGDYLLVNEPNEGIHILDNKDPRRPVNLRFLKIPGNVDILVRDDVLYADNYIDLVAFDISDPLNAREVGRIESAFVEQYQVFAAVDAQGNAVQQVLTEWVETEKVEKGDCQSQPVIWYGGWCGTINYAADGRMMSATANSALGSSAAPPVGIGGSMSRFAQYDHYLYAINSSNLALFDISTPASPQATGEIYVGWGIETLFPYGNKLFIGSQNGLYIYDNADPASPQQLSRFAHVQSCDPVVVQGDFAYVTLRNGTECNGYANQLDVLDIRDLTNPTLLKTYPMTNPHGLGIDGCGLFICDGADGLKAFNAENPLDITPVAEFPGIDAYDVIAYDDLLIMIGQDGIYQYRYNNMCDAEAQVELLSTTPIYRPTI